MIFTDPGYSLCWDNVALESKARYSGMDKGNKLLLFANAYGVENRVNFRHLDDHYGTTRADFIPTTAYVPTHKDEQALHHRMVAIVERKLVEHVPFLKKYSQFLRVHLAHKYSDESRVQSKLVINFFVITIKLISRINLNITI